MIVMPRFHERDWGSQRRVQVGGEGTASSCQFLPDHEHVMNGPPNESWSRREDRGVCKGGYGKLQGGDCRAMRLVKVYRQHRKGRAGPDSTEARACMESHTHHIDVDQACTVTIRI